MRIKYVNPESPRKGSPDIVCTADAYFACKDTISRELEWLDKQDSDKKIIDYDSENMAMTILVDTGKENEVTVPSSNPAQEAFSVPTRKAKEYMFVKRKYGIQNGKGVYVDMASYHFVYIENKILFLNPEVRFSIWMLDNIEIPSWNDALYEGIEKLKKGKDTRILMKTGFNKLTHQSRDYFLERVDSDTKRPLFSFLLIESRKKANPPQAKSTYSLPFII